MAPCAGRCRAHCPHRLAGRARAASLRAADAQRVSGGAAVRAGGGGLRISAWRERVVSTHPSLFRRAPGVFEGGLSECPLLGGRRADADLCAGLRRLRLQPRPCPYPPRSETRSHRNAHLFFICPRQNARAGDLGGGLEEGCPCSFHFITSLSHEGSLGPGNAFYFSTGKTNEIRVPSCM